MNPYALSDEEKLMVAYGDRLAAVRALRERVGGIYQAMRAIDAWKASDEARDLGVVPYLRRDWSA